MVEWDSFYRRLHTSQLYFYINIAAVRLPLYPQGFQEPN